MSLHDIKHYRLGCTPAQRAEALRLSQVGKSIRDQAGSGEALPYLIQKVRLFRYNLDVEMHCTFT